MTRPDSPLRVLVLCTGNSCRSQMAEGFLRTFGKGRIEAFSAGTNPQGLNQRAVSVMKEIGIDISSHRSHNVDTFVNEKFDYIITVCDNAAQNCPTFPGSGKRLHWPFDDPAKVVGAEDHILNEFRRVRDLIGARVREWVAEQHY